MTAAASRLAKFERYARWIAGAAVLFLLLVALLWRAIMPHVEAMVASQPGPTLILAPGTKVGLQGKIVYLFGTDDCHRRDWFGSGSSTGRSDDHLCVDLGGQTANVFYKTQTGEIHHEVLAVVHNVGAISLRRADGSFMSIAP